MAINSHELFLLNYRKLPGPTSLASDVPEFTRRSCELNQTFVSITQRVYRLLESHTRHGLSDPKALLNGPPIRILYTPVSQCPAVSEDVKVGVIVV